MDKPQFHISVSSVFQLERQKILYQTFPVSAKLKELKTEIVAI